MITIAAFGNPVKVGHVKSELISEVESFKPGQSFLVGLKLEMDEHWHVYWRNPGDAGTPPGVEWTLPEGFVAGEIQWPYPEKITLGPLANYGYHSEVVLPVKITPPANLLKGKDFTLSVKADWLVCKEVCIPGSANLDIELTASENQPVYNQAYASTINNYLQNVPLKNEGWKFSQEWSEDNVIINMYPPDWFRSTLKRVSFFPYTRGVIDHTASQELKIVEDYFRLLVPRDPNIAFQPDPLEGILLSNSGWRGPESEKAVEVTLSDSSVPSERVATASSSDGINSFWMAILFAFVGGIILNLMPCVLPVLSLKILGFVQQSGESRSRSIAHGLTFTSGVLLSFWVLVSALLALQAGGESIGWGFQLQSPEFLMILSGFLFLFGLNMLGVFEIGSSMTGVGAKASSKGGWSGSFLNGVTATIVATPCTAPFMGSALGYSLAQPPLISILIFTALGLGMASPYIVLSAFPGMLKFLPKPGPWMNTLKQVMGFLLIATVIWLAWVLSIQAGATAVVALLAVLFMLGLGAWVLGKWGNLVVSTGKRFTAWALFTALLIVGIGFGLFGVSLSSPASAENSQISNGITWEKFSPEKVTQLRAEEKPVFIDFTAAWCLSCQVNERVAFGSQKVRDRINELDIIMIKADWTNRDETITKALAEFGRNSVPLYVLFEPGNDDPVILPEILTPSIVLKALGKLEKY